MILGGHAHAAASPSAGGSAVTIEEVFRRHAQRRPDACALADAANRESFIDEAPRRLTYAEADGIVAAVALRLRGLGLPTDTVVGIQLPNIVENVLAMLGVLRAGMIVAPLPLLWRRADAVAALARVGAKALITCGRVGAFNQCQFAMRVAAEVFSIRYVCAFGKNLPDGVVSFEDLFGAENLDSIPPPERGRSGNAAAHVAAITFDIGERGLVPVARSHAEFFAAGLAVLLESGLAQDAAILSPLAPSSFAGISLTLLPWLLSGGTLVVQHPADLNSCARQWRQDRCDALILPAGVVFRLAETGVFASAESARVIAAWRAPEQLALSPTWSSAWHGGNSALVDVSIFGETVLVPMRRGRDGRPNALPLGPITAPRGANNAVPVAELVPTEAGTVAARGPMVPRHAFPPGIERSGLPYFKIEDGGLVDTGYACRVDQANGAMIVSAAPSGIASVGGYRFPLHDLQDVAGRIDSGATLAALPDPVLGQRLIGNAADRDMMQAALAAVGVNPIVVGAFRDRSEQAE